MEFYAKVYYEYYHGEKLNLHEPKKYVEKLQWLKVYFHPPILHQLVDKYAVRTYVEEKIGKEYLNELYQVFTDAKEIDWNSLPQRFVVKGTHGCNMHAIVKNKDQVNRKKLRLSIWNWKRQNLYHQSGQEWAYKNVAPRVIIEKYMEDRNGELLDYKFFTFHGVVKFIQVHKWFEGSNCLAHFDLNWNRLEVTIQKRKDFPGTIDKPKNLLKMVELAGKLADRLPFVRVDLYNVDGKIIFGELTFYPSDARKNFYPEDFNQQVSEYLTLPELAEGEKEITTL